MPSEDLVELGMEGFDRVVDKHYDTIHDHCDKGYHKARNHLSRRGHHGHNEGNLAPNKAAAQRVSSEEPQVDRHKRSPADFGTQDPMDKDDQGNVHDHSYSCRRPRSKSTASRENEPANGRKPYPAETPRENNHDYPPAHQTASPVQQPHTTRRLGTENRGPPVILPYSAGLPYVSPQYTLVRSAGPPVPPPRHPSSGDRRHHGRDNDPPRRSERKDIRPRDGKSKHKEDHSLSASIAGALAGGILGHQAGRGDVFATAAGAIVGAFGGALGGGLVADKHEEKKRKREATERQSARRYSR